MEEKTLKKAMKLLQEREKLQKDKGQFNKLRQHIITATKTAQCEMCTNCFQRGDTCYGCRKIVSVTKVTFCIDGTEYKHDICSEAFSDLMDFAESSVSLAIDEINKQIKEL